MSLLPMLFSSWWEDLERPHHLFDQQFGLSLNPEDLPTSALAPHDTDILVLRPRRRGLRRYQPYERSVDRRFNGSSIVQAHKNKFEVTLDVQQFAPEEVTVKVVEKNVVVEAGRMSMASSRDSFNASTLCRSNATLTNLNLPCRRMEF